MDIIAHTIKYLRHDLNTKFYSCKTYSTNNYSIKDVCRKYHISKASLMRWMNRFDETKESLVDRSKKPLTAHPNAHKNIELKNITNLLKRNPNINLSELYGKLEQHYAYTRHPSSLFRSLRTRGILVKPEFTKTIFKSKKYDTPTTLGDKMQLDVKFVPKNGYNGRLEPNFFQYTIIDGVTKERFLYANNE